MKFFTREAKLNFLNKLKTGNREAMLYYKDHTSTDSELLYKLFKILEPWINENNFKTPDLQKTLSKEGYKLNHKICIDLITHVQNRPES